jgi:hypothetical protein
MKNVKVMLIEYAQRQPGPSLRPFSAGLYIPDLIYMCSTFDGHSTLIPIVSIVRWSIVNEEWSRVKLD